MPRMKSAPVDWEALLAGISRGKTAAEYSVNRRIFDQGQPADSIFYLRQGKVRLSAISAQGREAIIATRNAGDFLGEGCLAGQPLRISTATAVNDCSLYRIEKALMMRLLHEKHEVSELFVANLLCRNIHCEADLVDQLFNSSEKRLARTLLLLSHFGKESRAELVLPRVSQANLAKMVGTTRSRVSHFMNKFRELRFIDYSENDGLTVHSGLLSVVLHDWVPAIPTADKATAQKSAQQLRTLLTGTIQDGLQDRFNDVLAKSSYSKDDVAAGREFVKAYVGFIHYAEQVYQTGKGNPSEAHPGEGHAVTK